MHFGKVLPLIFNRQMEELQNRMMTTLRLSRFKIPALSLGMGAMVSLLAGCASTSPHLLVVTAQNSRTTPFQLLDVSGKHQKRVSDITGNFMYGNDDANLAIVEQGSNGCRVLTINRHSGSVSAKTEFTNVWLLNALGPISDLSSVNSKDSTICFPATDTMNGIRSKLVCADWTHKNVQSFPDALGGLGLPMLWTADPVGFAVAFPVNLAAGGTGTQHAVRVAPYNVKAQKQLMSTDLLDDGEAWYRQEIFFAPGIGLMHSYRGTISQITGTNCATLETNRPRISTTGADTKIFVRNIKGKTCLIWGEDNSAAGLAGKNTGLITDVVVFDLEGKTELLRKALTPKASVVFQPDTKGEKIYFVDPKTGKASCLDVAKQTITPFADLGMNATLNPTIVDAY